MHDTLNIDDGKNNISWRDVAKGVGKAVKITAVAVVVTTTITTAGLLLGGGAREDD